MKIAIIELSNTSSAAYFSLLFERIGLQPINFQPTQPITTIADCVGFILLGEFGEKIAAGDLANFLQERNQIGQPILGMGEGACFLANTGIVPGLEGDQVGLSVKRGHFGENEQSSKIYLADNYQLNAFTKYLLPKTMVKTHWSELGSACHPERSEGSTILQFIIPPGLFLEMQIQGQLLFYYAATNGNLSTVAAISNKRGNALAMLPLLSNNQETETIFLSMRDYIQSGLVQKVTPLYYQPRTDK